MTENNTARTGNTGTAGSLPGRPAALDRLDVFAGKWNTCGEQMEGPVGPAAAITAVQTFEWLDGGLFLIHRFDGRVGEDNASCIEIIGYDTDSQSYPVHTYYNNGLTNHWRYRESAGAWTLTGDWEAEGKAMQVRCRVAFSEAADRMTGKWECSADGVDWRTFWDVVATKAA